MLSSARVGTGCVPGRAEPWCPADAAGEGEEQAAPAWPCWRHAVACSAPASPGHLALAEISSPVIPASLAGIS